MGSTLSLITPSSVSSLDTLAVSCDDNVHIPSELVYLPTPYDSENIMAIAKVSLGTLKYVYHTEIWRGSDLPDKIAYEDIDSQAVYDLCLAPFTRSIVITEEDGTTHQAYEVVLPPYCVYTAVSKATHGIDPDFAGSPHQTTHYDSTAADVWAIAYLLSPQDLLFELHSIQNHSRLRRGAVVKAPGTWLGNAVVVEKLVELNGWTLMEFRLLTTNSTIYVRIMSDLVAMDRTGGGATARWMRIHIRRIFGRYDEEKYYK
ncbi:hypothetical protein B0H11DRAFT_1913100 [Mycena galericulata]|nr:hypothetical protein B0H11DRAFT_1913100 [Mycena galericulata]